MSEVTRILTAIEQGDAKSTHELLPVVYNEQWEIYWQDAGVISSEISPVRVDGPIMPYRNHLNRD